MKNIYPARFGITALLAVITLTSCHWVSAQTQPSSGKPKVDIKRPSVYDGCKIVNNNKEHAILPIGSIVFLPDRVKSRVSDKPEGRFKLWPDFLKRNRDWIWTFEVTLDQAKGIAPIPQAKLDEFTKLNRMVVATNNGNPVAILSKKQKSKEGKAENK
ncbi:hypothetical protein HW115_02270 [Verrucomicrobiaceae bacterium N1E253]|uniref:Lipoprotein n=1 Tax=Oceaniferula marina TaxID=2748318 RepID=A0A851GB74_9BACT|nr:hypothetical protein [Oceaniferula marina]NWK54419.1 hypothetical protein [Oceaniferula marina]